MITPTGAFLHMHLLIERQVKELIVKNAPNPEPLRGLTAKLDGRARIAFAFGIIDERLYNVLIYLDDIRNDLTHQLEYKVDLDAAQRLAGLLGVEHLSQIRPNNWEFYTALAALQLEIWGKIDPNITVAEVETALSG
mgnify:CR=1 FL=1